MDRLQFLLAGGLVLLLAPSGTDAVVVEIDDNLVERLTATQAALEASGASSISITVDASARADASGASRIVVFGDAEVDASTSGGSRVDRG